MAATPATSSNGPVGRLLCLQINTGRSRASHDLTRARAENKKVDFIIISEPNKNLATQQQWPTDENIDSALVIMNKQIRRIGEGKGRGYVWVETLEFCLYSCYVSPNIDLRAFEVFLCDLGRDVRNKSRPVIIGGDFNAHSYLWSSRKEDRRGDILAEWISQHDLVLANQGDNPTFQRNTQESILDLTMCSSRFILKVQRWEVSNEESLSWHKMIYFDILSEKAPIKHPKHQRGGWRINKDGVGDFNERLEDIIQEEKKRGMRSSAKNITTCITRACNDIFPKKRRPRVGKSEVYWWNDRVKDKRKECIKAKRRLTRINRRGLEEEKTEAWDNYKNRRLALKKEIASSKHEAWSKIITDLDQDIFGQGYRIVTNKLRVRTQMNEQAQMTAARALFPTAEPAGWRTVAVPPELPPLFQEEDLLEAVAGLKLGKAAGIDNIPPEIAKAAAASQREIFLEIANDVITKRIFPDEWKDARLVLIEKPKKSRHDPPSYRPICLLDTTGKIVESMICRRINKELEDKGDLSDRQFGFRKGKSTIQAMEEVINNLHKGTRKRNNRGYCVLITLDVQNAFNSAKWPQIIKAMEDKRISSYLVETVKSYLADRFITVGEKGKLKMTCGVPQGSKMGPLLWNIMYDGVFNINMPDGATIVGFADDIGIVVTAWTPEELQAKSNAAVDIAIDWLHQAGLTIAPHKTEAVLLAGRRSLLSMDIQVQDRTVTTSSSLKYLGVHFDKDLRMTTHVVETAKKARMATRNLSRLMPNIGGPIPSRRRVLNSVVNSIILYAAPVWRKTMEMAKYRDMLLGIQRTMAIRVSSAYRTISTPAAQVLAGIVPIDLLITERARVHEEGRDEMVRIKMDTMRAWQTQWSNTTKGSWTKMLIKDIEPWVTRKHGELDFHLTQVLSGHGCFQAYLLKINRRQTGECVYCQQEQDTAEHTLFVCPRWEEMRRETWQQINKEATKENLVATMLEGEEAWKAIKVLANNIMRKKEEDEREEEEMRREQAGS